MIREKIKWKRGFDRIIYMSQFATVFLYPDGEKVKSITMDFGDERISLDKRRLDLLISILEEIKKDGYEWKEVEEYG